MPTLGAGPGAAPIPSEGTSSAAPGRTGDGGAAKALHRAAKSLLYGESTTGSVPTSSSPAALSKRRSLSCCPGAAIPLRAKPRRWYVGTLFPYAVNLPLHVFLLCTVYFFPPRLPPLPVCPPPPTIAPAAPRRSEQKGGECARPAPRRKKTVEACPQMAPQTSLAAASSTQGGRTFQIASSGHVALSSAQQAIARTQTRICPSVSAASAPFRLRRSGRPRRFPASTSAASSASLRACAGLWSLAPNAARSTVCKRGMTPVLLWAMLPACRGSWLVFCRHASSSPSCSSCDRRQVASARLVS